MQDLFIEKPVYIEVSSTVDSREKALQIARILVEKKLAACVQVTQGVTSIYRWQGSIENTDECILTIKSKMDSYGKLVSELKRIFLTKIILHRQWRQANARLNEIM